MSIPQQLISLALRVQTGNVCTKMVLVKLASSADANGYCQLSIGQIMEDTELSRSSVIRHIKQLEDLGYLRVLRWSVDGGNTANHYQLCLEKLQQKPAGASTHQPEKGETV